MQSNSSGSPAESKKQHQPKFRGTWNPAELHYLLSDGKINGYEFVLLSVIDSLVDPKGDGCWASNAYLAKRIGKSTNYVRLMLRHLRKLDLIKQVGWKRAGNQDFRVLETAWSRVPTLLAGYPPTLLAGYPQSLNTNVLRESKNCRVQARDEENGGFLPLNGEARTPEQRLARLLEKELRKNDLLYRPGQIPKWPKQLKELLRTDDFNEVARIIRLHGQQLKKNKWWPQACSAVKFVEKYADIKMAEIRLKQNAEQDEDVLDF